MITNDGQSLFYLIFTMYLIQLVSGRLYDSDYYNNLASMKTTKQIGDYDWDSASSKAVDYNDRDTCAFAFSGYYQRNVSAWWQVDLGDLYVVKYVKIVAPITENYKYLANIMVMVGDDDSTEHSPVCATFNDSESLTYGSRLTLNCSLFPSDENVTYPIGRYVTIKSNGGPDMKYLSMCDVEVFGTSYICLKDKALRKPARQSGVRKFYIADRAVDSDPNTCSFAETSEGLQAWWQVDLGGSYQVSSVDIMVNDADDAYKYLQYFIVMVKYYNDVETSESDQCFYYGQAATLAPYEHSVNLTMNCNRYGRFVTIKRLGGKLPSKLALCDVKVNIACVGLQCIDSGTALTTDYPDTSYWRYTTMSWYYPTYPYYRYIYSSYGLQAGDIAAIVLGITLFAVLIYSARITYLYFFRNRASQKKTSTEYKHDDNSTAKKALIEDIY